jgi:ATP-grasp domain, R2K clade family 3
MMKPTWLIETGVWKDDNVSRMIAILRGLGLSVHAEQYTYLGGTEFEIVDEDCPVIFYGSLNTGDYLRALRRNWVPLIWFDKDAFSCRSYYAHWGQYLLQEHYGFYPLAEVSRLKEKLYRTFGKEGMVFIRPDENDKSFSGRLVPEDNFPQWHEETQAGRPNPAALAVVSSPVRIEAEWRFVIADRKVITGSYYKGGGKLASFSDSLRQATLFAEEVATAPWQPRAIYCMDVAYTAAGRYRLMEIGGINSAGLYRCELLPVIRAMNEIAERDFRSWRGKA